MHACRCLSARCRNEGGDVMVYGEGTILVCTASTRQEKACIKEWLLWGERTFLYTAFR